MAKKRAPIRTYGLTHIALSVRDARQSLRFYQKVFGVIAVYEEEGFIQAQTRRELRPAKHAHVRDGRLAGVDQLANPRRDRARLAHAPVLARPAVRALVGHEQLHRMSEDRIRELGGRGERLVLVAERARVTATLRGAGYTVP